MNAQPKPLVDQDLDELERKATEWLEGFKTATGVSGGAAVESSFATITQRLVAELRLARQQLSTAREVIAFYQPKDARPVDMPPRLTDEELTPIERRIMAFVSTPGDAKRLLAEVRRLRAELSERPPAYAQVIGTQADAGATRNLLTWKTGEDGEIVTAVCPCGKEHALADRIDCDCGRRWLFMEPKA